MSFWSFLKEYDLYRLKKAGYFPAPCAANPSRKIFLEKGTLVENVDSNYIALFHCTGGIVLNPCDLEDFVAVSHNCPLCNILLRDETTYIAHKSDVDCPLQGYLCESWRDHLQFLFAIEQAKTGK